MYNNTITENDYEQMSYIEDAEYDSFKLLTGQYAGVIFTFGEMSITEPLNESEDATLKFEYVINKVHPDFDDLEKDSNFNNHLGNILSFVLDNALNDGDFRIGEENNESRDPDNNFKESD